jgi:hypothetical protein
MSLHWLNGEAKTPPSLCSACRAYAALALDACLALSRGRDSAGLRGVIGCQVKKSNRVRGRRLHHGTLGHGYNFDVPCGPRSGIEIASGDFGGRHVLHKGCHEVVDVECGESGDSPDPDLGEKFSILDNWGRY